MGIIEKVKDTTQKHSMLSQQDRILVGLSGGPDSVCLLIILNQIKAEFSLDLFAAYIDHGFRPHETPYEMDFCKELCNSLSIPITIRSIDVKSFVKEKSINKQEAARELRYSTLDKVAIEVNANKIALGHNADDQTETILMRLFRGTGPSGLSGMPPVRGQNREHKGRGSDISMVLSKEINIIRPLIEIERDEIEQFLESEGIGFVVDSSNFRDNYLRNKIRHSIIPEIKKINIDFIKTISKTANIFRDEERYFEIFTAKALIKLVASKTANVIELFLAPLEATDAVLLRRVLRRAINETTGLSEIGFTHIENIINLIKSGRSGDRIYLPKGVRAIKGYSTLIITSEKPAHLGTYVMNAPSKLDEIILRESSMVIHFAITDIDNIDKIKDYVDDKKIALIDAEKVHFPLIIRGRLPGDYFYPSGFGKRKKIQDYFVDEKIPRDERDAVPLLTCNNNIVWIIGYRLDERYEVDKNTKRVLKLESKLLKT